MSFVAGSTAAGNGPLRAAFALAVLARGLCWCFADLLLGYHLYRHAGLTSGQTGLVLMALLLVGAAADLGAGLTLKRLQSRRSSVLAVQRVGATVAAIAVVPLFFADIRLAGALLWGVLFRAAFAFYAVPQTTLLSLLPNDDREQRLYVTLHSAASASARLMTAGGALVLAGGVMPMFLNLQVEWLMGLAGFAALTALLLEWVAGPGEHGRHFADGQDAVSNVWPAGYAWCLLALASHACALFMMSRLFLFMPDTEGLAATGRWIMLAWAIGMTVGSWTALHRSRKVLPIAVMITAAASALLVPSVSATLSLSAAIVYGIGLSASGAALLNTIARQVRHGTRSTDGLAFAIVALVTKCAMAAGNGALAFLLDGYVAGEAATGRLLIAISLAGGLVCLLAWWRASQIMHASDLARPM